MRRNLTIAVTLAILLSPVLAGAQTKQVTIDHIDGLYNTDTMRAGDDVTFYFRVVSNGTPNCYFNPSFCFGVYSEDGATWVSTEIDTTGNFGTSRFAAGIFWGLDGVDGEGIDSVALAGIAAYNGPGLEEGYNAIAFTITVHPTRASDGMTICIDTLETSSFAWEWSGLGPSCELEYDLMSPDWYATPQCYHVYAVPDIPPVLSSGDLELTGSHCSITESYAASDPDGSDAITWTRVSGIGSITSNGYFSYSGSLAAVGVAQYATIRALESDGAYSDFPLTIMPANQAPTFTSGCNTTVRANIDREKEIPFGLSDICSADPKTLFVIDDGGVTGSYYVSGNRIFFTPVEADLGMHSWSVGVTDGLDSNTCFFSVEVTATCCGIYTGGYAGNTNCDERGRRDLADISRLIDHIYVSRKPLCCPENGNVNGDPAGGINLADVARLIDCIYISHMSTAPCP